MAQVDPLREAVVLAGGLGTRLGALTAQIPKPLVPVAGKPFLYHQLRLLQRHGVRGVLLLTGHLGEKVEEVFGNGSDLGLSIRYSRETSPVGTGGALALAGPSLPPEFFLVYGDSYLDCDYQAAALTFRRNRLPGPFGLMVVGSAAGKDDKGNVRLDDSRTRVASYCKGAGADHDYMDAGVMVFSKDVVDYIPEGGAAALEELVYPRLAGESRLLAFITSSRFYDIGTPERLDVFERSIS